MAGEFVGVTGILGEIEHLVTERRKWDLREGLVIVESSSVCHFLLYSASINLS